MKSSNPAWARRKVPVRRFDVVVAAVLVVAAAAAAVLALNAGSLVPVWCVAIASLALGMRRWFPTALSAGLSIALFFAVELVILSVTPLLGLTMVPLQTALWAGVAMVAALATAVSPNVGLRATRQDFLLALAATTGSIVFLISMIATQLVPGALRLIWAMNGDTVNAMGFARQMLVDGGIDPVSTPQVTPLPFAMAASNMESGRAALAESALLEHDVARTAQVWIFVIALTCLLVGITVAHAVKGVRLACSVPVVALSSMSLLVWYVIGVQFRFGFMNTAFALALLCAGWLIFSAGTGHTLATLAGILTTGLGILAVWSPLVICIAGLGIVVLASEFVSLRRARPQHLIVLAIAAVVFAGYAITVTVPSFLAQSSALGSDGGFPPIGPASIIVITALTFLCAAIALQSSSTRLGAGTLAVVAGFAIGLGYLLLQRQGAAFGWGYYPAKFAWTTSILLVVILATLAAKMVLTGTRSRSSRALLTVAAAASVASLLWGPVLPGEQLPLPGMIAGNAFDQTEARAEVVFELAGRANGQDVLWRTTGGDQWANAWLLQIDRPADDPVKLFTTVPTLSPAQMCDVVTLLGDDVIIHTSDPAANSDLRAACPAARFTIVDGEF